MNYNDYEKSTDLDPFTLGYNYKHGIGVEKDEHKAFVYYQQSANMGNVEGIHQVGQCYLDGTGVEQDYHKAFIYYQKSAEMGNVNGIFRVGYCYRNGIGVEKDEHKAFIYYQKSAEMGHANGTYNTGSFYQSGIGVEKDVHKAFIYYQRSAEMGHALGTYNVGHCYGMGIGVEKDVHKAFNYYQKSADMGDSNGTKLVGQYYLYGTGVEKDEKKAFEYFKKAADMGHPTAILQVGDCYRNGIGVPRDIQRANHWYRIERGVNRINKSTYENVDDNLKKILDDEKYQLLWIPYNEFQNVTEIGKGGFATVYYALWLDKNRNAWTYLALKLIHGSNECNQEFVDELKTYCDIGYENPSFLKCYGISRDDKSNDYIIVLKYARKGSLRQNIGSVAQIPWKDKLNVLYCIASDLESIHSQELIHRDFHSGNILQDNLHSAYVTDLGLSTSSKEGEINGCIPYVAPEVLSRERPFTQAADIYGFGIIMTEISSGKRAFDGEPFEETKFVVKICKGKRPEFGEGTPECFIKLAKRCMDQDPEKRPTATILVNKIGNWLDDMNQEDGDYKQQFEDAEKIKPETTIQKHPYHMFTSKPINTQEITKALLD